ncbi:MAG TPA: hypothetical protein VE467_08555 [Chryseolinea sp.]|jgi:hypothetical protein|nr:hypothetical protein [Chryseolinea sp.]HZI24064.1 hypothetical protein [Chryseolinea sp.]
MKRQLKTMATVFAIFLSATTFAQENDTKGRDSDIQTVFKGGTQSIRGYGAITNKFTYLGGEFANLVGAYGGVYINHQFMIGVGAAAMTNNLAVPLRYSVDPLRDMSYEYGQVGLMMEYVVGSNKAVHVAFSLFSGAGFTLQHERYDWHDHDHDDDFDFDEDVKDENWFFVAEPGVQVEVNVFKWMRFCPGISYRAAFESDGLGMKDSDISNVSYNATLKFGRF